jgi:hypothetical protein
MAHWHYRTDGVICCLRRAGAHPQDGDRDPPPRRREVLALTTTPGVAALWLIPGCRCSCATTLSTCATPASKRDLRVVRSPIRYVAPIRQGQPLFRESLLRCAARRC